MQMTVSCFHWHWDWYMMYIIVFFSTYQRACKLYINITFSTSVILLITKPILHQSSIEVQRGEDCDRKWPLPQRGVIGNPIKRKCHAGNCVSQCESSTWGGSHWIQARGDMWHWSLTSSPLLPVLLLHSLQLPNSDYFFLSTLKLSVV